MRTLNEHKEELNEGLVRLAIIAAAGYGIYNLLKDDNKINSVSGRLELADNYVKTYTLQKQSSLITKILKPHESKLQASINKVYKDIENEESYTLPKSNDAKSNTAMVLFINKLFESVEIQRVKIVMDYLWKNQDTVLTSKDTTIKEMIRQNYATNSFNSWQSAYTFALDQIKDGVEYTVKEIIDNLNSASKSADKPNVTEKEFKGADHIGR